MHVKLTRNKTTVKQQRLGLRKLCRQHELRKHNYYECKQKRKIPYRSKAESKANIDASTWSS